MRQDERQYTLQELATTAGVSIRTIRYYIGEGLLPAPVGAGPQSHYTQSHLNRLRAIGLLKNRYLPLREIRRALSGLDDRQIEELIGDAGASESLQMPDDGEEELSAPAGAPLFAINEPAPPYDTLAYIDSALERGGSKLERRSGRKRQERRSPPIEGESWQRIEVTDGVELLVRDELYRRRREQIDWLIDWARKVVD